MFSLSLYVHLSLCLTIHSYVGVSSERNRQIYCGNSDAHLGYSASVERPTASEATCDVPFRFVPFHFIAIN